MKNTYLALALLSAATLAACDAPGTHSGRGERREAFRAACGADMETYCPNVQRGERRACIAENRDKFSEGCKTYMAQNPWRRRNRDNDQGSQSDQPATP